MPRNGCDSSTNDSGACGGGNDGCIYSDEELMETGVVFRVKYTGCIEVKTSMSSLDFSTRTQVARECINRVCETAGLKVASKRRVDKKILEYISDKPCMENAGRNVLMSVSSRSIEIINVENGEIIAGHNMPRISFASGGDANTLDFLAYIAKNEDEWRACYVIECYPGQSEDLIVTIGKSFMLRFNALSRKTHQPPENYNTGKENDKDYYNDLPNKLPPDLLTEDDLTKQQMQVQQQQQKQQFKVGQLNLKKPRDRLSSNLIDLNSPPPDQTSSKVNLNSFDPMKSNSNTPNAVQAPVRDVFDIQPYS
ncbi:SHC-transforming protein 3-like, partial [Teleopsis dalmanni]|uniref:SHC-transforming protein 3-like n=1 Tax=Teleopsis dalmanni TaxID=139649 RepID=UPI0018CE49F2